jgi:4,4'-diaponeurosporenoate glycosyltransferase
VAAQLTVPATLHDLALVAGMMTAVVAGAGALVAAWRLRQVAALAARPTTGPTARAPGAARWPRVSIIVPARNEAHNLPRLLSSLRALAPAPAEIIVVDDHSTDGTGDIARAAGATVIAPPPLPAGWLGKSWACHAGAAHASGELLLFTDADTAHGPRSLGDAVARLEDDRAELLSAIPTHRIEVFWERLQGVFQLLLLVACRAGAVDAQGRRRFSIGQYLLFRRSAYDRIGGHEPVRASAAEDLALAERIVRGGGRFSLLATPGTVEVRMYPEGFGAFLRGWRRSFRDGLRTVQVSGGLEMMAVMGWLLGIPLAAAGALALSSTPWLIGTGVAYAGTAAAIARAQRRLGAFPAAGALAFPFMALAFAGVSAAAAFDHLRGAPVRWRGRTVQL